MKKKVKVASNAEQKSIIKDALQSSENEQLDLYNAVFGGAGSDCPVVAVARLGAATAYNRDTFLRAIASL
ncbi:MAG: hypothetical protein JNM68_17035 [Dinghuibacter sp.]|nr:hypothetical protein [Dinghuibacter sp.]